MLPFKMTVLSFVSVFFFPFQWFKDGFIDKAIKKYCATLNHQPISENKILKILLLGAFQKYN